MKKDIVLKYSKKERDFQISWVGGAKANAYFIMGIFDRKLREEMAERGMDIKTLRVSINQLVPASAEIEI